MADKSASLYVRMKPETKEKAEEILNQLGVSPSTAINMFYEQVIMQKGIPFEVKLPKNPVDVSDLSKEEIAKEVYNRYLSTPLEDYIPVDQLVAETKAQYNADKKKSNK